ncbi:MAG: hypothetical protein EOO24_34320, partial [Comamonadaceae bacterium]
MSFGSAAPHDSHAWHWRHLLLAPHRLGFFLAMVVLAAAALWWAAVQLQRSGALPALPHAVSPSLVHATVMTFGFMPLFFSGFLFTAGPKWLRVSGPSARRLAPVLVAQAAGWFGWLAGSHVHAAFAVTGLSLAAAGLAVMTAMFWRLIAASHEDDRLHAKLVGAALAAGCACLVGISASTEEGCHLRTAGIGGTEKNGIMRCATVTNTTTMKPQSPVSANSRAAVPAPASTAAPMPTRHAQPAASAAPTSFACRRSS